MTCGRAFAQARLEEEQEEGAYFLARRICLNLKAAGFFFLFEGRFIGQGRFIRMYFNRGRYQRAREKVHVRVSAQSTRTQLTRTPCVHLLARPHRE